MDPQKPSRGRDLRSDRGVGLSIPHLCSFSILNMWLTWQLFITETCFHIKSKKLWLQGCTHGYLWQLFLKNQQNVAAFLGLENIWEVFFSPVLPPISPAVPRWCCKGIAFHRDLQEYFPRGWIARTQRFGKAKHAFLVRFPSCISCIRPSPIPHADFRAAPPPQRLRGFSESPLAVLSSPLAAAALGFWDVEGCPGMVSVAKISSCAKGPVIPEGWEAGPTAHPRLVPCPGWALATPMRSLLLLDGGDLFAMQDLLSRSPGKGGNGKSWVRFPVWDSPAQERFSFPGVFALPTVWTYPDQTCRGKSWLHLKSHYGSSAFHHPADALCCSIAGIAGIAGWGRGKALQDSSPPTSPHLHPRGAQPAGMTLQPCSGLNHQSWHQQWGFLANIVRVLGKWGCRGGFSPARGPPEQHI